MRKIITSCILSMLYVTFIPAQEPCNNIGKNLSAMKKEFPELRYLRTDEKGDFYEDGYPEEGIAIFFYFRNNIVIEECMTVESDVGDGFTQMWYDSMVKAFQSKHSYAFSIDKTNRHHWCYSDFQIHLILNGKGDKTLAMIIYQKGGYNTGISRNSFYEKWK